MPHIFLSLTSLLIPLLPSDSTSTDLLSLVAVPLLHIFGCVTLTFPFKDNEQEKLDKLEQDLKSELERVITECRLLDKLPRA